MYNCKSTRTQLFVELTSSSDRFTSLTQLNSLKKLFSPCVIRTHQKIIIMKIICVGYSKTGTKSMTKALTELGFVVHDFEQHYDINLENYITLLKDEEHEGLLKEMYETVDAVIAFPSYIIWQKIFKAFPDSKVILTTRENYEVWFKSFEKTHSLMEESRSKKYLRSLLSSTWSNIHLMEELAFNKIFPQNMSTTLNKENWINSIRLHEASVKQLVPKDQLLVYKVGEGWERLCKFLNKSIPVTQFPKENITEGNNVPIVAKSKTFKVFQMADKEFWRSCLLFHVVISLCCGIGFIFVMNIKN
ncbi:uncharacterized protein LOC136073621 isoform X2 [Hydra vulgaris]|uniref:uncharacterized protein LOC136073621 isoform X2 n=2 Tax=Hydra vulgaris TaxID=6087 RepID=UPI0032E9E72C